MTRGTPGRLRLTFVATLALFGAAWATAVPGHSATTTSVAPSQALVALLTVHEAFAKPAATSTPLARVLAHRGEAAEAEALITEALDLSGAIDFPDVRARALSAAAEVTGDAELLDQARSVYEAKGNTAAAAQVGLLQGGGGLVTRPIPE